jgi:hypothetical protein
MFSLMPKSLAIWLTGCSCFSTSATDSALNSWVYTRLLVSFFPIFTSPSVVFLAFLSVYLSGGGPDIKISDEEIADIMANDIIKREIIDSDESKKARKEIDRLLKKAERAKEKSKAQVNTDDKKPDEQAESPPENTASNESVG